MTVFAQVPSSTRSREAIERKQKELETKAAKQNLHLGSQVFIRIFKGPKKLEMWMKKDNLYFLMKTYDICYYSGELGPKTRVGDNQAPEGFYEIWPACMNPMSNYHLSFNIGYPNAYERAKHYTRERDHGAWRLCLDWLFCHGKR